LLHIHLSPPHEVCDCSDQAAHYHNLGPQLGASLLTQHIGWKQGGESQFVFGLSCIVQPTFPDMLHIHPSMDECWINEMYMYVCMYVYLGINISTLIKARE
jgi:hypothetical protein